jgi:hypothetical protein
MSVIGSSGIIFGVILVIFRRRAASINKKAIKAIFGSDRSSAAQNSTPTVMVITGIGIVAVGVSMILKVLG